MRMLLRIVISRLYSSRPLRSKPDPRGYPIRRTKIGAILAVLLERALLLVLFDPLGADLPRSGHQGATACRAVKAASLSESPVGAKPSRAAAVRGCTVS